MKNMKDIKIGLDIDEVYEELYGFTNDVDINYRTALKAYRMINDYALTTDPHARKIYKGILDRYIYKLNDEKLVLIYSEMATASDDTEKDVYTEILTDLLTEMVMLVPGGDIDE